MSFGSDMRDLASELCFDFAGEKGKSTLYKLTGESYNTASGKILPTYELHFAYMPEEEIIIGSAVAQSGVPFEFTSDHRKITVAGKDLTVKPAMGDLIQAPDTLVGHQVVHFDVDMYEAAFVLYVLKAPSELPVVEPPS
jgi:hypothetical protein